MRFFGTANKRLNIHLRAFIRARMKIRWGPVSISLSRQNPRSMSNVHVATHCSSISKIRSNRSVCKTRLTLGYDRIGQVRFALDTAFKAIQTSENSLNSLRTNAACG